MGGCGFSTVSPPTEEEISTMQKELEKYGINMPSFGKIGGILAKKVKTYYNYALSIM